LAFTDKETILKLSSQNIVLEGERQLMQKKNQMAIYKENEAKELWNGTLLF